MYQLNNTTHTRSRVVTWVWKASGTRNGTTGCSGAAGLCTPLPAVPEPSSIASPVNAAHNGASSIRGLSRAHLGLACVRVPGVASIHAWLQRTFLRCPPQPGGHIRPASQEHHVATDPGKELTQAPLCGRVLSRLQHRCTPQHPQQLIAVGWGTWLVRRWFRSCIAGDGFSWRGQDQVLLQTVRFARLPFITVQQKARQKTRQQPFIDFRCIQRVFAFFPIANHQCNAHQ